MQQALRDALVDIEAELAAAWPTLSGAQLRAKIITELAITQGLQVFEQLRPEAWVLPFDVVLVPWREES